ncbi:MAG: L-sorbosone dehydrogenase [Ferruginibacter sp.]|nr:L-sorbosone dehydrogenase [Ferruginibacter sp.]
MYRSVDQVKKIIFDSCMVSRVGKTALYFFLGFTGMIYLFGCNSPQTDKKVSSDSVVTIEAAHLQLPAGFSAVVVADSVGKARHLAVNNKGDIYVKLNALKDGKGIIYLRDTNGDGKADEQTAFGDYAGTGMYIRDNYLYASSNEAVYRYRLNDEGKVIQTEQPETIIKGLIDRRQHNSKSIVLDHKGNIYVNIGAYSNACQVVDRTEGSPGRTPCPVLDSAAGIWQFKADQLNQSYNNGTRYATGLRNVVGLDWNEDAGQLFVMQHGRDQLFQQYPKLYTAETGAELPAETMYALNKGDDCGWPYIYYDQVQKKKILGPEYGGDGKKTGGEKAIDPVVAFPGHMAPNGLLFYTGNMFPDRYKKGAFIAFHGSWNRAPEKQKGYFVAFVPFKDGRPSGEWEIFANNFAGTDSIQSPGDAKHRPCGLAQGPDGSLYVSDDSQGTIYRISYAGK